jgi:transcriptional regulator with XRE-family HTH domain
VSTLNLSETLNPLESWRQSNGLTAKEAAARIEISLSHWYDLVKGKSLPRPQQGARIAEITGVSRSALAAWMETPNAGATP